MDNFTLHNKGRIDHVEELKKQMFDEIETLKEDPNLDQKSKLSMLNKILMKFKSKIDDTISSLY